MTRSEGPASVFQGNIALQRNVHSQVADRIGALVVREAIRTLTGKGLVESRPKSGTRVRPREEWNQLDVDVMRWQLEHADTDSYLAKIFQLRNAMEPTAAALAATAATDT